MMVHIPANLSPQRALAEMDDWLECYRSSAPESILKAAIQARDELIDILNKEEVTMRRSMRSVYIALREPAENEGIKVNLYSLDFDYLSDDFSEEELRHSCITRLGNGMGREIPHQVYHSPTGMEYGYGGSGPTDLAFSILADRLEEPNAAKMMREGPIEPYSHRLAHEFLRRFVESANRELPLIILDTDIADFLIKHLEPIKKLEKIQRQAGGSEER